MPGGQFVSVWIAKVEAGPARKGEDGLGNLSASVSDLLLR
jgi:hypothetical protein